MLDTIEIWSSAISQTFLTEFWLNAGKLETNFRPFYDFIKMAM